MSSVQEAFKGEQVDKDLGIEAPANKAEVSTNNLKQNVWVSCVLLHSTLPPLQVVYDSGVNAELGNILTPTLVQNQPKVTWPTEEGALYTVLLTGENIH